MSKGGPQCVPHLAGSRGCKFRTAFVTRGWIQSTPRSQGCPHCRHPLSRASFEMRTATGVFGDAIEKVAGAVATLPILDGSRMGSVLPKSSRRVHRWGQYGLSHRTAGTRSVSTLCVTTGDGTLSGLGAAQFCASKVPSDESATGLSSSPFSAVQLLPEQPFPCVVGRATPSQRGP